MILPSAFVAVFLVRLVGMPRAFNVLLIHCPIRAGQDIRYLYFASQVVIGFGHTPIAAGQIPHSAGGSGRLQSVPQHDRIVRFSAAFASVRPGAGSDVRLIGKPKALQ